jgi:guanylate kinase
LVVQESPLFGAATVSDEFSELRFVVLSGPSGVGKSTLVDRLVEAHSRPGGAVRLVKSISATTRPPRRGETDGTDYHFLTKDEFERRRLAGEFLECAEVHSNGNWYGTLKSEVRRARELGGWALLEIDVQGAMSVVRDYPQAVTIFVTAPSVEEFERRLRDRGTESEQAIQTRLATARRELEQAAAYRHRVVNDDLEAAVARVTEILLECEERDRCSTN